ncbi:MAG: Asp-tRNA(Asn)/Glu-tRNA(Gln) amidotransferase subunit GatA [Ferruginibacter sp.]
MFQFTSIESYHEELRSGKISCTDAITNYLSIIEEKKHLNAFVEVYADEAIEKAAQLDKQRSAGMPIKLLHGVVIAIKDVICYKDHKITAASKILKDFTSLYSSSALQLLLQEDAIVIGSCNCDEFAMGSSNENSAYGPVLNAADEGRVPGGSSGGSAVAVQAGMCMLSIGSDTGGSVRQPADFCGLIGFKPGYGSISRYGLIAYASSFDQIGIFGKNLNDVRLLWEIMNMPDKKDSTMRQKLVLIENKTQDLKPLKLAVFSQAMAHPGLDEEIASTINNFSNDLKGKDFTVDEIELDLFDYVVPAYYVLTTAEASSNLSRYDGVRFGFNTGENTDLEHFYNKNRSEGFGLEVKRRIMLGTFVLSTGYYDAYFTKAQQIRKLLVDRMSKIFEHYDGIIMPVSPTTAFKIGEKKDPVAMYLADIYTVLANLCGLPAIALPMFSHSNNMPYGLQIMAKAGDELTLLNISEKLLKHSRIGISI